MSNKKTLVFAVGGGAIKALNLYLKDKEENFQNGDIKFISIDTSETDIAEAESNCRVLMDKMSIDESFSKGLFPINFADKNNTRAIIVSTFGRKASLKYAPQIAELTAKFNIPTQVIFSMPEIFEGRQRLNWANEVLLKLARLNCKFDESKIVFNAAESRASVGYIFDLKVKYLKNKLDEVLKEAKLCQD